MKKTNWTTEEIEYLKLNYDKKTYAELAAELDRTIDAVRIKSKKCGLTRRYMFDKSFFQDINTEEKAYWLGFIAADGYITHSCSYEISIELQELDKNHLKKFNKSIGGNVPVDVKHVHTQIAGREVDSDIAFIRLYSKDMYFDLISHNVVPRKTNCLTLPNNINDDLFRHYLRGYFDGNGSIGIKKVKKHQYVRAAISSGSIIFVEKLREVLFQKYNILSYIALDKNAQKLEIGYGDNMKQFLNLIYQDSTIYLDRKYKRYTEYLNNYMRHE